VHSTSLCHKSACELDIICRHLQLLKREQKLSAPRQFALMRQNGDLPDILALRCASLPPRDFFSFWHCPESSRPTNLPEKPDLGSTSVPEDNKIQQLLFPRVCDVAILEYRGPPPRRLKCPFWSIDWNVCLPQVLGEIHTLSLQPLGVMGPLIVNSSSKGSMLESVSHRVRHCLLIWSRTTIMIMYSTKSDQFSRHSVAHSTHL
jgi:hypothetical protein